MTYEELRTIQNALIYKIVWDDSLTELEKESISKLTDKITLEKVFKNNNK